VENEGKGEMIKEDRVGRSSRGGSWGGMEGRYGGRVGELETRKRWGLCGQIRRECGNAESEEGGGA